jgi:hypothetical protein
MSLQGTHSESIYPLPIMPYRGKALRFIWVYTTHQEKYIFLVLEVYLCYQKIV